MGYGMIYSFLQRHKDMKENRDKVVFSMNIREQRQQSSCGCGHNCGCNGSSVKRRELRQRAVSEAQEKKQRRIAFWNVFKNRGGELLSPMEDVIDDIEP